MKGEAYRGGAWDRSGRRPPTQTAQQLWTRSLVLTALAAVTVEIFLVLLLSEGAIHGPVRLAIFLPYVGLLVLTSRAAKRCGITVGTFFASVFFGLMASCVLWFFIPPLQTLAPRYFAVNSTEGAGWAEWTKQGVLEGFLYRADDPDLGGFSRGHHIGQSVLWLAGDPGKSLQADSFVFWQAGLARGYDPSFLREYAVPRSFWEDVELIASVITMACLELAFRSLTMHFPAFLTIVLLYYAVKRSHIWFE